MKKQVKNKTKLIEKLKHKSKDKRFILLCVLGILTLAFWITILSLIGHINYLVDLFNVTDLEATNAGFETIESYKWHLASIDIQSGGAASYWICGILLLINIPGSVLFGSIFIKQLVVYKKSKKKNSNQTKKKIAQKSSNKYVKGGK